MQGGAAGSAEEEEGGLAEGAVPEGVGAKRSSPDSGLALGFSPDRTRSKNVDGERDAVAEGGGAAAGGVGGGGRGAAAGAEVGTRPPRKTAIAALQLIALNKVCPFPH